MANVKITDLAAASALDGTEELEIVQGGTNKAVTPAQILTYIQDASGPDGTARDLGQAFWRGSKMFWSVSSSTAPSVIGVPSTTFGATASRPTIDNSAPPLSARLRLLLPSNTTASSSGGWRSGAPIAWRGNAAGRGGFWHIVEFGMGAVPASVTNAFVGFSGTTGAITSGTQPADMTDIIGMGFDRGDANWSIYHNDASGVATEVALGASFPVDTTSLYRLLLYALPNGGTVGYHVENIGTGATASGTLASNLPSTTTFLGLQYYSSMNSGTTACAIAPAYAEGWHGV